MKKSDLPIDEIVSSYRGGDSTHQLAKKYNTYPKMIIRILNKFGVEVRNKSDAQKNALANGATHPTEGRERTQEEIINIRQGMKDSNKIKESE